MRRQWECVIAVIADDDEERRRLERLVRSLGFDTEAFSSESDFRTSHRDREPDCVVLGLRNTETGEAGARMAEAGFEIPVVVVTAGDVNEPSMYAADSGLSPSVCLSAGPHVLMEAILGAVRGPGETRRRDFPLSGLGPEPSGTRDRVAAFGAVSPAANLV